MNIGVTFDFRLFHAGINAQVERTKKPIAAVLRNEARLFVEHAQKLTPPTGNSPKNESHNAQIKAGRQAIKNDVSHLFSSVEDLGIYKNPKKESLKRTIDRYIRTGNVKALEILLREIGINNPVYRDPSAVVHKYARDKYGRIPKSNNRRVFVLRARGINTLLTELYKKIGRAKSGWNKALTSLGGKVPMYISRHTMPGSITDQSRRGFDPYIEVSNDVDYAQKHRFRKQSIIQRALNERGQHMINQLNGMLGKEFQGYYKSSSPSSFQPERLTQ